LSLPPSSDALGLLDRDLPDPDDSEFGQDYFRLKRLVPANDPSGWMIALAGDAERKQRKCNAPRQSWD
jgi:hypothetical protein